jgi:type I restriction enzyme S subunit
VNAPLRVRQASSAWPRVRLSDIAEHRLGKMLDKAKNTGVPRRYLRNPNVRWFDVDLSNLQEILVEEKDIHKYELQPGDVVICEGGEAGRAALWKDDVKGIIFQKAIHRVRVGPRLDARFLIHRLMFDYFNGGLEDYYTGATIKHFTGRDLARYEIPLPPLDEQWRIALILDKADALRRKRKRALDLLDSITKSIFLEIFGDPVTNPKKFRVLRLGEIGTLDRGVSKHRPRNDPILLDGSHPLIQTGDVSNSGGYIRGYTSTYSDIGLKQSKLWPAGTLCITIAANIAETGILTFPACFPDSVVGFTHENPAMAQFVRVWLSFLQANLERMAPTVAQKNINLQILRDLFIAMPPLDMICLFGARLEAQSSIDRRLRSAAAEVHELFSSLQHRAFSSQL